MWFRSASSTRMALSASRATTRHFADPWQPETSLGGLGHMIIFAPFPVFIAVPSPVLPGLILSRQCRQRTAGCRDTPISNLQGVSDVLNLAFAFQPLH